MISIFLADGFEEIEAVVTIDVLRRSGARVQTVSIMNGLTVVGSHDIRIQADALFLEADFDDATMLVLPGGGRGTDNLLAYRGLKDLLTQKTRFGIWLAAICAAPKVLAQHGLLQGKRATIYDGMQGELTDNGACYVAGEDIVVDAGVVTSRGPGTALPFALCLVELLKGAPIADKVRAELLY